MPRLAAAVALAALAASVLGDHPDVTTVYPYFISADFTTAYFYTWFNDTLPLDSFISVLGRTTPLLPGGTVYIVPCVRSYAYCDTKADPIVNKYHVDDCNKIDCGHLDTATSGVGACVNALPPGTVVPNIENSCPHAYIDTSTTYAISRPMRIAVLPLPGAPPVVFRPTADQGKRNVETATPNPCAVFRIESPNVTIEGIGFDTTACMAAVRSVDAYGVYVTGDSSVPIVLSGADVSNTVLRTIDTRRDPGTLAVALIEPPSHHIAVFANSDVKLNGCEFGRNFTTGGSTLTVLVQVRGDGTITVNGSVAAPVGVELFGVLPLPGGNVTLQAAVGGSPLAARPHSCRVRENCGGLLVGLLVIVVIDVAVVAYYAIRRYCRHRERRALERAATLLDSENKNK